MSRYLDELMRFSDRGYVERYDDIEEAIDKVLNTRLEEMHRPGCYDSDVIARRLFLCNNVPSAAYDMRFLTMERLGGLKVSELIALAEHHYKYDEKRGYGSVNLSSEVFELLFHSAKRCFNVQFFMSLSVKALADYADKKTGGTKGSEMYSCIRKMAGETLSLTIDDTFTLQRLFSEVRSAARYYSVSIGLDFFRDRVRCGRNILKKVLTDMIKLVRPEIFDFVSLKKRICSEMKVEYAYEPIYPFMDTSDSEEDEDIEEDTFCDDDCDESDLFEDNENVPAYVIYDSKKDTHSEEKKHPTWDEVVAPFRKLKATPLPNRADNA